MNRPIPFIIVFLVINTGALFAQTGGAQAAAQRYYNQGQVFMADEDWYQAAAALLEALKQNPAHSEAALSLAECYYELNEYEQALSWVRKARTLARTQTAAANLEAFVLIALGRLDEAAPIIAEVLKREPYNREALFAAGELDIARGRAGDAARRYRDATRLYPRDRRLLISLAMVLSALGDSKSSREFIERAQQAYPDDYRVYYYAAYLKAKNGELAGAISDAEQALYLRPDFPAARSLLAQIRYRNGNFNETLKFCDIAIAENRAQPAVWYLRGMALNRLGRGAEARRSFETAIGLDNNDEWARQALEENLLREVDLESPERAKAAAWHFERARQAKLRSLYDDALFEYRRGLRLNPYAQERYDYAGILLLQGFRRQYLEELLFIQNESGKANNAVNDAIETSNALLKTTFAARNPIGDEEIKPHWNIAIFTAATQSSFYHADAGYLAAAYLKDITVHIRELYAMNLPLRQNSFSTAFRTARENKADYFLMITIAESERDLSISGELYVARTGSKAADFKVFRAGSDRLRNASRALSEQIAAALPFRAVLLRRQAGSGIIDKGKLDNLKENAVFNIVKAGKAELKNEGIGVQYQNADITGTFTVKQIDEEISGGTLERVGFFDLIAPGDEIFEKPETPPADPKVAGKKPAPPAPAAQDPELRALLRALR
ncbi:MAG: tetratricopeptide repeat protein [Spirochaetaceae bacterium]|jgi:tetratricopeptide (TPR) repeat protein|nr:tetratricopeptide repeat protein [Spirochaetaceae bacterium]